MIDASLFGKSIWVNGVMSQIGLSLFELDTLFMFSEFTEIETLYGSVIPHYTRVNYTFLPFLFEKFKCFRFAHRFLLKLILFVAVAKALHHILGSTHAHRLSNRVLGIRKKAA